MQEDVRSSETLTQVRLDPKTKYFAVLLSKRAGLSLSDFVTNCVEAVLTLTTIKVAGQELTFEQLEAQLWHEHPADRFALLAGHYPGEMTVRERLLWLGIIRRSPEFWRVPLIPVRVDVSQETFCFDRLRARWAEFEAMNRDEIATLAQEMKHKKESSDEKTYAPELQALQKHLQQQLAESRLKLQQDIEVEHAKPKPSKTKLKG